MSANLTNFLQNNKNYYVKKCYNYRFLNYTNNIIYNSFNFVFIINILIAM